MHPQLATDTLDSVESRQLPVRHPSSELFPCPAISHTAADNVWNCLCQKRIRQMDLCLIRAKLDTGTYASGRGAHPPEIKTLRRERNEFHGDGNYTLQPRSKDAKGDDSKA